MLVHTYAGSQAEPGLGYYYGESEMIEVANLIDDSERQPCEIWTRVMGYHRPVENFNVGKKGEKEERVFFQESIFHVQEGLQ